MAGRIITVMPARRVDFGKLTVSNTQDLVVGQGIDVSRWSEVSVVLRVFDANAAGGQISILVQAEGRTAVDPGILFAQNIWRPGPFIIGATEIPYYDVISVTAGQSPIGAMVRVIIRGERTSDNPLEAVMNIDLSLKTG